MSFKLAPYKKKIIQNAPFLKKIMFSSIQTLLHLIDFLQTATYEHLQKCKPKKKERQ